MLVGIPTKLQLPPNQESKEQEPNPKIEENNSGQLSQTFHKNTIQKKL